LPGVDDKRWRKERMNGTKGNEMDRGKKNARTE